LEKGPPPGRKKIRGCLGGKNAWCTEIEERGMCHCCPGGFLHHKRKFLHGKEKDRTYHQGSVCPALRQIPIGGKARNTGRPAKKSSGKKGHEGKESWRHHHRYKCPKTRHEKITCRSRGQKQNQFSDFVSDVRNSLKRNLLRKRLKQHAPQGEPPKGNTCGGRIKGGGESTATRPCHREKRRPHKLKASILLAWGSPHPRNPKTRGSKHQRTEKRSKRGGELTV